MSRDVLQMEKISERLNYLIKSLGYSYSKFSKIVGLPYPTLQKYLRNERIPSIKNLQKIATRLGINLHWLLTGEDEMFIKKPFHPIKKLSKEFKKTVITRIVEAVPVLGYLPSNFPSEIPEDAIIEWIYLPSSYPNSIVFKFKGDSMSPIIKDGDYVVISSDIKISFGDIVVFIDEWQEIYIKRYRKKNNKIYLVSENPEYPIIEYDPKIHKILGKVTDIWVRKKW